MSKAIIDAVASHLPERVVTNEEIAARSGAWSAADILKKTGIRERHIVAEGECASDLAVTAARRLIDDGRLDPADVDYLLFCTQSPDYFLPTTACLIQDRLGLPRSCGAIDFNQGCSGYVFGLSLAKGLIESGQARCVLLLTAETYSRHMHPADFSVCTLFGDGAAATVVRASEKGGVGPFVFGTDGRGAKNLIVPTGGMRQRSGAAPVEETRDADGNVRTQEQLYMNGREIFRFAISEVPLAVQKLLDTTGLTRQDIDYLLLHQANRFMLDELVRRVKFPPEKVPYVFEDIGNTVSSTLPIVLERLQMQGALHSGQRLLLVGFGVGYSWGACLVEWEQLDQNHR